MLVKEIKLWDVWGWVFVEEGEGILMDCLVFYPSLTILREVISSFYRYQVTANNWSQNSNLDFVILFYFPIYGFRGKKEWEPYYRQRLDKRFHSWGPIRKLEKGMIHTKSF